MNVFFTEENFTPAHSNIYVFCIPLQDRHSLRLIISYWPTVCIGLPTFLCSLLGMGFPLGTGSDFMLDSFGAVMPSISATAVRWSALHFYPNSRHCIKHVTFISVSLWLTDAATHRGSLSSEKPSRRLDTHCHRSVITTHISREPARVHAQLFISLIAVIKLRYRALYIYMAKIFISFCSCFVTLYGVE